MGVVAFSPRLGVRGWVGVDWLDELGVDPAGSCGLWGLKELDARDVIRCRLFLRVMAEVPVDEVLLRSTAGGDVVTVCTASALVPGLVTAPRLRIGRLPVEARPLDSSSVLLSPSLTAFAAARLVAVDRTLLDA